jgi:hypothetical protein
MCTPVHGLYVSSIAETPESPCTGVHISLLPLTLVQFGFCTNLVQFRIFSLNKVVERTGSSWPVLSCERWKSRKLTLTDRVSRVSRFGNARPTGVRVRKWLCPTGCLDLNTPGRLISLKTAGRPFSHERTGREPRRGQEFKIYNLRNTRVRSEVSGYRV